MTCRPVPSIVGWPARRSTMAAAWAERDLSNAVKRVGWQSWCDSNGEVRLRKGKRCCFMPNRASGTPCNSAAVGRWRLQAGCG